MWGILGSFGEGVGCKRWRGMGLENREEGREVVQTDLEPTETDTETTESDIEATGAAIGAAD